MCCWHLSQENGENLGVIHYTGNKMADFKIDVVVRHRKISSTPCTKCKEEPRF